MLKVGIHDDLVLEKAGKNDKGTLALVFRPKSLNAGEAKKKSVFQEEEDMSVSGDDSNSPLLIFPFKISTFKKKDGSDFSDKELIELAQDDMKKLKNQLTSILGAYMPLTGLKWRAYDGTGITEANYEVEMLDNDNLFKIYTNYVDQFLEKVAPFLNDDNHAVRLKLVRQSKDKHYATIPSRYLDTNPFIEPMEVPKDRSQLKYTKYEKDNGLDNGDAVSKDEADAPPETTPEASSGVFGAR